MKRSAPSTRRKRQEARYRIATQFAVTRVLAEAVTLAEAAPKIVQAIGETVGWEMGAIWEVARHHFQPSVFYTARMIVLDSRFELEEGANIQTRTFRAGKVLQP